MTRRIELFEMDDYFQEKVIDIVQATTLEWTLSSPPPFHTYEDLPRVN